jgi:hypothetical protein
MNEPTLYLGYLEGDGVGAFGVGYTDAGEPYDARARSNRHPAAGAGGEAMHPAVSLVLTHRVEAPVGAPYDEVEVVVQAVLDEAVVAERTVVLRLTPIADRSNPPALVTRTYHVGFSVPHEHGGQERARQFPRGTWFQLDVRWPGSDVIVDGGDVEYEIVTATRRAVPLSP